MNAERRARRLLRWYPPAWRERYGEEFAALLEDQFRERHYSPGRGIDVARAGIAARAAAIGVGGDHSGDRRLRLDLALLAAAATAFLVAGVSVWSQLDASWQWIRPHDPALRTAWWLTSVAVFTMAAIAAGLLGLLLWRIVATIRSGHGRRVLVPLAGAVVGAAVLSLGSVRFGSAHWIGSDLPGAGPELVPAGAARVAWAAGWWLNAYWAHPALLAHFSRGQVAWLLINPLALAATIAGLAATVRRLGPAPRVLSALTVLAGAAVAAMAVLLAGAGSWIVSSHQQAPGFQTGTVDLGELGLMGLAFLAAVRLTGRATRLAWRR